MRCQVNKRARRCSNEGYRTQFRQEAICVNRYHEAVFQCLTLNGYKRSKILSGVGLCDNVHYSAESIIQHSVSLTSLVVMATLMTSYLPINGNAL